MKLKSKQIKEEHSMKRREMNGIDERMDRRMGWMDAWIDALMDRRMDGCKGEWERYGYTNRWVRKERWMNG